MTPNLFRRIRCKVCGARFSHQEDMMNHMLIHESPKYDCTECGRMFAGMEEMRTHLQREHGYKPDRQD